MSTSVSKRDDSSAEIKGIHVALVMVALSIATCLAPLDVTIANVSIPHITGDLGVEVAKGRSIITSYFIGEAIGLPLVGWLSKRLGDVRLLLIGLILFGIFSFLCARSFTLSMLVICRFIQGLASGLLIPLSQSILFRCVSKEKALLAVGMASVFFVLSIMAGPLLGGWLTTNYSWPWIFYINVPLVVTSGWVIWQQIGDQNLPIRKVPLDWIGLFSIFITVSSLQMALDHGQEWDWFNSHAILTFFAIAFVSAAIFALWEVGHPYPFLDLPLFKKRSFLLANILMWLTIIVNISSLVIMPLWLQTYKGYDAFHSGLATTPFGVGAFLAAISSNLLIRKLGLRGSSALGALLAACACFYVSFRFTPDMGFRHLLPSSFILGSGIMLNYITLTLLCRQEIETQDQPSAFSIFHFSRSIFAAIGASLFITLWQRKTILFHNYFIEKITPFSANTNDYLNLLKQQGLSHQQSLEMLNQTVNLQAATLSFTNCYYVLGWISLFMFFLCFLGRRIDVVNMDLSH